MSSYGSGRRTFGIAVALVALLAGACTAVDSPPAPAPSDSARSTASAGAAVGQPFGPGCPNLPDSGPGSLIDLGDRSWLEALAEVPALSQLSVTSALSGLTDSLKGVGDVTVFAPDDTAFRRLGAAEGRRLLTQPAAGVEVLSYHIVPGRLTPETLVGTHRTLTGQSLQVTGTDPSYTVNGRAAITCGNLQTKDATIYIVDRVLQPS